MGSFDWKIAVPWLLTLFTAGVGIWQYADKSDQSAREPFLRQQLTLVTEAVETVGTLASSTDTEDWELKRERFWALYWGSLSMVEDPAVERWMVRAGQVIPKPGEAIPPLPLSGLTTPSLCLAHAARDLVLSSWNVKLPQLARPDGCAS